MEPIFWPLSLAYNEVHLYTKIKLRMSCISSFIKKYSASFVDMVKIKFVGLEHRKKTFSKTNRNFQLKCW